MVYDWFNRQASDDVSTEKVLEEKAEGSEEVSSDSSNNQEESSPMNQEESSLEWARSAYARLKAQQEQQKTSQASVEIDSASETALTAKTAVPTAVQREKRLPSRHPCTERRASI